MPGAQILEPLSAASAKVAYAYEGMFELCSLLQTLFSSPARFLFSALAVIFVILDLCMNFLTFTFFQLITGCSIIPFTKEVSERLSCRDASYTSTIKDLNHLILLPISPKLLNIVVFSPCGLAFLQGQS